MTMQRRARYRRALDRCRAYVLIAILAIVLLLSLTAAISPQQTGEILLRLIAILI